MELYVAGALSEKENQEVYDVMQQYPEVKAEVEEIEKAIRVLTKSMLPTTISSSFESIRRIISKDEGGKVVPLSKGRTNWAAYTGWAASVILAVGLFWMFNQNNELKSEVQSAEIKNAVLEKQIEETNYSLNKASELLSVLRDKNRTEVPLAGQTVDPEAYASVYIKDGENTVYIDALGLPDPPEGKVYQVWSLKLSPLTPTSIGLLEDFATDENKIFALTNVDGSEAFGITLEPAGGSPTPNLEQLYTLGAIQTP
ncbi:anti-sigma factor [Leptobacterium flavescens]|uniref:anti-sigma factor n=1 Tax=Leptobacterium flavescens TaxID=472055 RepID=UPI0019530F64|nr:anti-sigma factor [Leptobacterium flavescens]